MLQLNTISMKKMTARQTSGLPYLRRERSGGSRLIRYFAFLPALAAVYAVSDNRVTMIRKLTTNLVRHAGPDRNGNKKKFLPLLNDSYIGYGAKPAFGSLSKTAAAP